MMFTTRREVLEEGSWVIDTTWEGGLTTVKISDGEVHAKGNARWHYTDEYNEVVGKNLAFTRALYRWAHKRERFLVKQLP